MYDAADSILAQKLSQMEGVGQVTVGGGAKPAVRVEINPRLLNSYGIGREQVRHALNAANANRPKGLLSNEHDFMADSTRRTNFKTAAEYRPLVVSYTNGAGVRLGRHRRTCTIRWRTAAMRVLPTENPLY